MDGWKKLHEKRQRCPLLYVMNLSTISFALGVGKANNKALKIMGFVCFFVCLTFSREVVVAMQIFIWSHLLRNVVDLV